MLARIFQVSHVLKYTCDSNEEIDIQEASTIFIRRLWNSRRKMSSCPWYRSFVNEKEESSLELNMFLKRKEELKAKKQKLMNDMNFTPENLKECQATDVKLENKLSIL